MIESIFELFQFEFMRNALLVGVLVSIACGIVGTFVVVNRIVFISGGIAHAAYGGIGLGYFYGFNPIVGAIIFALMAALGMGWIAQKTEQRADTLIGVMWAVGMAIGIILVDLTPGYKADLMSYLFGSILTVSKANLLIVVGLNTIIILIVTMFYKELLAISFDRVFALTRDLPADTLYLILVAMIALTVVMVMQIVGLIMVIALLTIPAAIAEQFLQDLKQIMIVAIILGGFFTTLGLGLSYYFNLTSGATIILISGITYLLSLVIKQYNKVKLS
ncbi:MAG: metal ABC transporter permease [cyanobacterium endosymbiont of Rhopalodia inflata]